MWKKSKRPVHKSLLLRTLTFFLLFLSSRCFSQTIISAKVSSADAVLAGVSVVVKAGTAGMLPNGFVPNIAPEYFIAGSPDITNPFRNPTQWGSSFIIVPWQQYLFAGDVSLLRRHCDKMKNYVAFLLSTVKDNITTLELGHW